MAASSFFTQASNPCSSASSFMKIDKTTIRIKIPKSSNPCSFPNPPTLPCLCAPNIPCPHLAVYAGLELGYIGDNVDPLSQSLRELGRMGQATGEDFAWHISIVQTWASTALTNQSTCLNRFAGACMDGNVMAAIRRQVVDVSQATSNALALVNHFASRH